jgi:hypothetical protein
MEGKSGLCKRRPFIIFIIYDIPREGLRSKLKQQQMVILKPKTVL